MAPSTEIAGVMMPSPYSSAAPNSPSATSAARRLLAQRLLADDQREHREDAAFAAVVGPHHEHDVLDARRPA